jgi:sugar lactone lactonase YvrE
VDATSGTGSATSNAGLELVVEARADLGEGPLWEGQAGRLLWVDMTRHLLHSYSPETRTDSAVDLGLTLGSIVPDGRGGLVVAGEGGLFALGDDSQLRKLLALGEQLPGYFLNDSCCDPTGSLWVGVTTTAEVPGAGSFYRVRPDLTATVMLEEMTIPNGLDWSLDGQTLYVVDSPSLRVDAFAFDLSTGGIGKRHTFASFEASGGVPDGLTVDAEGGVWVAFWGGWAVRRFTPGGREDLVIEVPVEKVSSCAFGGRANRDLYITTASTGLDDRELQSQPAAGGLFRFPASVAGRPVRPFRWTPIEVREQ